MPARARKCQPSIFALLEFVLVGKKISQTHYSDNLTLPTMLGNNIDGGIIKIKRPVEQVWIKDHSEVPSTVS